MLLVWVCGVVVNASWWQFCASAERFELALVAARCAWVWGALGGGGAGIASKIIRRMESFLRPRLHFLRGALPPQTPPRAYAAFGIKLQIMDLNFKVWT